jgi:hypothetical protein
MLVLTSPTSGGSSVGIVRLRTKARVIIIIITFRNYEARHALRCGVPVIALLLTVHTKFRNMFWLFSIQSAEGNRKLARYQQNGDRKAAMGD